MTAKVLPHRKTVNDLLLLATKRMTEAKSSCVRAGETLLELRERIEAGEAGDVGWWDYYEKHFAFTRRHAERLMALASQENPQQAHEQAKAKHAADMRERRVEQAENCNHATHVSRKNNPIESSPRPQLRIVATEKPQEPELRWGLIEEAIGLVRAMSRAERLQFVMQLKKIYRE